VKSFFWKRLELGAQTIPDPCHGTLTRSRESRSTISTCPASTSRPPTLSRMGTPFSSQCAYLSPGRSVAPVDAKPNAGRFQLGYPRLDESLDLRAAGVVAED